MLKRYYPFATTLLVSVILLQEDFRVGVFFFSFFPLLLFPILFYLTSKNLIFSLLTIFLAVSDFFILAPHFTPGIWLTFALTLILFLIASLFYHRNWTRSLDENLLLARSTTQELETLKNKHQARLDNLKHLESQVSGLLDLFEIARDFGEILTFDEVANILAKKVLPQIPFKMMRIILQERTQEGLIRPRTYSISPEGIDKTETELSQDELSALLYIHPKDQLRAPGQDWIFPLLKDDRISSCMLLEGAEASDLAKFEVLCAYLPLQLKKIRLYEEVKELSIRDSLTGVFVRRHFLERFEEEIKRSLRYNLNLAVLMLDIDHFKRYNDEHGHLAGDETLKEVAKMLCASLRKVDIVARYGGEEFIVVIPETKRSDALEVAERIRSSIARNSFNIFAETTKVTVSIGLTLLDSDRHTTDIHEYGLELIRRADKALYHAKEEGRNQVVLFEDL